MSAVCSYGQGGGIIDVAIQQRTAEAYELSLDSRNGNQLKVTLTALDGTIYLEKLVSSEVVIDNLSSGAYQLITEDQTGLRKAGFNLYVESRLFFCAYFFHQPISVDSGIPFFHHLFQLFFLGIGMSEF